MNRLYEKLKDDEYFKDKLILDEAKDCLVIAFHEYLCLEYFEGDYTASWDEGYIQIFFGDKKQIPGGHWHIYDDNQVIEWLADFVNNNNVYVENANANLFTFSPLHIMKKTKFEKKSEKFLTKKHLRIYTANSIIKRNE